jgi:hypothetical protein
MPWTTTIREAPSGSIGVCRVEAVLMIATQQGSSQTNSHRSFAAAATQSHRNPLQRARPQSVVMPLLSDAWPATSRRSSAGHAVLGAGVPLVGGCAGDGFKMAGTYRFHGDQVLHGAAVGDLLGALPRRRATTRRRSASSASCTRSDWIDGAVSRPSGSSPVRTSRSAR